MQKPEVSTKVEQEFKIEIKGWIIPVFFKLYVTIYDEKFVMIK